MKVIFNKGRYRAARAAKKYKITNMKKKGALNQACLRPVRVLGL